MKIGGRIFEFFNGAEPSSTPADPAAPPPGLERAENGRVFRRSGSARVFSESHPPVGPAVKIDLPNTHRRESRRLPELPPAPREFAESIEVGERDLAAARATTAAAADVEQERDRAVAASKAELDRIDGEIVDLENESYKAFEAKKYDRADELAADAHRLKLARGGYLQRAHDALISQCTTAQEAVFQAKGIEGEADARLRELHKRLASANRKASAPRRRERIKALARELHEEIALLEIDSAYGGDAALGDARRALNDEIERELAADGYQYLIVRSIGGAVPGPLVISAAMTPAQLEAALDSRLPKLMFDHFARRPR